MSNPARLKWGEIQYGTEPLSPLKTLCVLHYLPEKLFYYICPSEGAEFYIMKIREAN